MILSLPGLQLMLGLQILAGSCAYPRGAKPFAF